MRPAHLSWFIVAALFLLGAVEWNLAAALTRGAFQAGVKIGAAPFDSLHLVNGTGMCERAEASVKR